MSEETDREDTAVVFVAALVPQACLIKTLLESQGIPASVDHEEALVMLDGMVEGGQGIKVRVARKRLEEARRVIAEARELGHLLSEEGEEVPGDAGQGEEAAGDAGLPAS
ncbi:MAG: hypothetical protein AB1486_00845 [Planctomycetota bacterium]